MYLDISCCVYCSSDEELEQGEGKLVSLVHVSHKSYFSFSSHEVYKSLFFGCMAKYRCLYSDDDYKIIN